MKNLLLLALFTSVCLCASISRAAAKKTHFHHRHADKELMNRPVRGPLFTFKGGDFYDFRNVRKDEKVTHIFQFTNTGDRTIHIDNVTANCGCASVKWDVEPILPGGKGHISVTLDSRELKGPFYKELHILSDAQLRENEKYYTLFVSGIAETESYKVHDNRVAGW